MAAMGQRSLVAAPAPWQALRHVAVSVHTALQTQCCSLHALRT